MTLRLDWCSVTAARFAVERWHYSRVMPTAPRINIGVWEHGRFIGVVIFSRGANRHLYGLKQFGLKQSEACELARVALTQHDAPVSRIVSIALKMLRAVAPGLRLVVSFADTNYNHHGGIYQASNWVYAGATVFAKKWADANGREFHSRTVSRSGFIKMYGRFVRCPKHSNLQRIIKKPKHRYLMPLDAKMRARVMPLAQPYPKRVGSDTSDTPGVQPGEGGATPTPTLQPT